MAQSRRLLIIDDDESVRMFVCALMEAEGWKCVEARNGEEGIDMALREMPELILLDLEMPGLDGFATFERIRGSHFTQTIPIIIFSGSGSEGRIRYTPEDFSAAFDLRPPEGYIEKPTDARLLKQSIFGVVG